MSTAVRAPATGAGSRRQAPMLPKKLVASTTANNPSQRITGVSPPPRRNWLRRSGERGQDASWVASRTRIWRVIMFPTSSSLNRRGFLASSAAVGAAQLGLIGSPHAQTGGRRPARFDSIKPGTNTSFGALKQIDAGVLNVGYAEAGPADGPAVILLHGWPYDIYSFVDVAPLLASAGYRVIIPYLRGYGTTRFISSATVRNGQPSALAVDVIALMDALKIEKATVAGFDWGARSADIVAALWPERFKGLVAVSGYLIGSQEAGRCRCRRRPSCNGGTSITLPRNAAAPATINTGASSRSSSGGSLRRSGISMTPRSTARAAAFDNPDHVAIVIHNYRWRLGLAEGEREIRRSGKAARRVPGHHRAHHHDGRRCERRAAPGPEHLCQEVLGSICAPAHHGRHRAQPAAGSPAGLRRSRHRCRRRLTAGAQGTTGSIRGRP